MHSQGLTLFSLLEIQFRPPSPGFPVPDGGHCSTFCVTREVSVSLECL